MDTNAHLLGVVSELKRENERLNAYIDGMHTALRRGGKVTIQNGVSK